jgi:hypothetical protein
MRDKMYLAFNRAPGMLRKDSNRTDGPLSPPTRPKVSIMPLLLRSATTLLAFVRQHSWQQLAAS